MPVAAVVGEHLITPIQAEPVDLVAAVRAVDIRLQLQMVLMAPILLVVEEVVVGVLQHLILLEVVLVVPVS